MKPSSLPPPSVRERECARAVERLFLGAAGVSLVLAVVERPRPPAAPPAPLRALPVDLSTDPAWMLRSLAGVGPARARAIVEDRERNGPLPSVEAIDRVVGFGTRMARRLAEDGAVASGGATPAGAPAAPSRLLEAPR